MKTELKKSRDHCSLLDGNIALLKAQLETAEEKLKNYENTINAYNIPLAESFTKESLYQQNKILNVLGEFKSCRSLMSFLNITDLFCLTSTCRLSKAFIQSNPAFFRTVAQNTYVERINLNTTVINSYIQDIKTEIASQDKTVIMGVKRYLYYNYSAVELIENLLEDSLKKIDQISVDLDTKKSGAEKPRAGSVMSFLKTTLQLKEEKPVAKVKFNKMKTLPLEIQEKVANMISSSPFEKFTLLDTENKKIEISNPKDYKMTQNKMFKEEIDKKSAEYIGEFNGLLMLMGKFGSEKVRALNRPETFASFWLKS